jgi:hypothetical protein
MPRQSTRGNRPEAPFDRPHAQYQSIRDFLVAAAGRNQAEYFHLPTRKRLPQCEHQFRFGAIVSRRADARYALEPSRTCAVTAVDRRGRIQVTVACLRIAILDGSRARPLQRLVFSHKFTIVIAAKPIPTVGCPASGAIRVGQGANETGRSFVRDGMQAVADVSLCEGAKDIKAGAVTHFDEVHFGRNLRQLRADWTSVDWGGDRWEPVIVVAENQSSRLQLGDFGGHKLCQRALHRFAADVASPHGCQNRDVRAQ